MINVLSITMHRKPCFFVCLTPDRGGWKERQGFYLKSCFSKNTVNCPNVYTGCQSINTDCQAKKEEKSSANRFEAGVTQPVESLPSNFITKMAEIQLQNGLKEAGRIPALSYRVDISLTGVYNLTVSFSGGRAKKEK